MFKFSIRMCSDTGMGKILKLIFSEYENEHTYDSVTENAILVHLSEMQCKVTWKILHSPNG